MIQTTAGEDQLRINGGRAREVNGITGKIGVAIQMIQDLIGRRVGILTGIPRTGVPAITKSGIKADGVVADMILQPNGTRVTAVTREETGIKDRVGHRSCGLWISLESS